ncbi:hypothetical protein [Pikeienuella sp. HZG-20]|uniref:hypothetical protein n=1 Tax=Paludibacillus litoralis TaxID=3133267 RepID=UPI0030ECC05A
MTRRKSIEEHLAAAPAAVRRAMIESRADLEPGAAAVTGRFFAVVKDRHEPTEAPGAGSFRAAAASESTLATLLRTLIRYAPDVSTAAAREVRAEWYARRPRSAPKGGRPARSECALVASWPGSWRAMYPALRQARIKESSRTRYIDSISRCAQIVRRGAADERLTFYTAWRLSEAFRAGGTKIKPITIANYLDALVALGRFAGADAGDLAGMRYMCDALRDEARMGEKRKIAPIADLMRKGGFEHIARRIGDMRTEAASLPDHSARKVLLLQTAAVSAIDMNKPARAGDMAGWRLGHDLWRATGGVWRLAWRQGKTGMTTEAGELWPEISEILDELILCGRPDRLIHLRYGEVIGKNWLTLSDAARPSKWPSERVNAAIGVPSHDLRTLAADYMRRHDPVIAARIISTHLGHATLKAGKEYSALSEGDAAARAWRMDRRRIAAAG